MRAKALWSLELLNDVEAEEFRAKFNAIGRDAENDAARVRVPPLVIHESIGEESLIGSEGTDTDRP